MMNLFFFFLVFGFITSVWGQSNVSAGIDRSLMTSSQWESVLARFEKEVNDTVITIRSETLKRSQLNLEIQELESQITKLRSNSANDLFTQTKLNQLLDRLNDDLQIKVTLERQLLIDQTTFSQKALSLIDLYNSTNEALIDNTSPATPTTILAQVLDALSQTLGKRAHIQSLLNDSELIGESSFVRPSDPTTKIQLPTNGSPEDLQLTLDLLSDRKNQLSLSLEQDSLAKNELENEIKLQAKMEDFMEDIQRMNEDAGFPRNSLKRNDISETETSGTLKKRLAELDTKTVKDQEQLERTIQLLTQTYKEMGDP